MAKIVITIVLAVISLVGTNFWQAASHNKQMDANAVELADVQGQLDNATLELEIAKVDLAASNAVIDRQNALIAAQEYSLQQAKALGSAKIATIQQDSARWRASATGVTDNEVIEAVKAHLVRFCLAPTGRGQDNRQTSEATECRSGVPQAGFASEDKAACAELGAGRADGAKINEYE